MENVSIVSTETPEQLAERGISATISDVKSGRIRNANGVWVDWKYELTESDIEAIADVLGGRHTTRSIIRRRLRNMWNVPNNWCLERITFCKHSKRWHYTAGQDYVAELGTIRRWFMNL